MIVYVIMSNDYPDCVFAEEKAAEQYVKDKHNEQKKGLPNWEVPRIYYKAYPFEVIVTSAKVEKG